MNPKNGRRKKTCFSPKGDETNTHPIEVATGCWSPSPSSRAWINLAWKNWSPKKGAMIAGIPARSVLWSTPAPPWLTMHRHCGSLQSKKITLKSRVKPEDPNIMEYQNISSLESKQQISGGSVIPRSHRDRGSAGRWSIYYLQLVMLLVYGKSSLSTKNTGKYLGWHIFYKILGMFHWPCTKPTAQPFQVVVGLGQSGTTPSGIGLLCFIIPFNPPYQT